MTRAIKVTSTKLVPNQVSLCSEVKFDDDKYEKQNDFNQVIIFMGIDPEKDNNDKPTGRYIVLAKIVTYNNIEDVQFIIEDVALAKKFNKSLNPYNAIKVSGHMVAICRRNLNLMTMMIGVKKMLWKRCLLLLRESSSLLVRRGLQLIENYIQKKM